MKTIQIQTDFPHVAAIVQKRIQRRCSAAFVENAGELTLRLCLDSSIGSQGYRISGSENDITVSGDGLPGLMAGIGKFLRTSRYTKSGFIPSSWRGTSIPTSALRGIQIDIHFCNFYHMASSEELREYTEDLAAYRLNGYDTTTIYTPEA